jgi:hypothetical protein
MHGKNRRIMAQVGLGMKEDPTRKIVKARKAGGHCQVGEHLPSKCKITDMMQKSVKCKGVHGFPAASDYY